MNPDLPDVLRPFLPPDGSAKILGAGGIGEKVAKYYAQYLSSKNSPGRMTVMDGDEFEPANAARMFFGRPGNKAVVLCEDLRPFIGDALTLLAVEEYLTAENAGRLIRDGDLVFCCVDNHKTRKLLIEHVRTLANAVVISGGNDGIEIHNGKQRRGTYGTVQIWVRQNGRDLCPDPMRFHPEIDQATDRHPGDKSCSELMTSVPQILFTNLAVASAMLNAFYLLVCNALHYFELCLDIAEARMQPNLPLPPGKTLALEEISREAGGD